MSEVHPDSADLIKKVGDAVRRSLDQGGISVGIASSSGKPFYFFVGDADITNKTPVTKDHVFGIGSITKVFIAVVILQLVEEGKLQLSDTVEQYLSPEIYRDIENAQSASVEYLLSHRAGIDSWEDEPSWKRNGRGKDLKPQHIWSKTETLDYIRRPNAFAANPGEWYYANTNYTLLGLIIERISGTTAEKEVRRRILDVLGMEETYFEGFEEPRLTTPHRYHLATEEFKKTAGICPSFPEIQDGLIDATGCNLSEEWTAGGMMSSAADLLKFAFGLRDGKLLRPASVAILQEWRPAMENGEMGHGLFRIKPDGRASWLGHSGGVLGFSSGLWWKEDVDCAFAILENVGTMHTGALVAVHKLFRDPEFLALASQLAKSS